MSVRSLILILALVVGAAALGGIAWRGGVFEDRGQPDVGGPFQLVDQEGRPTDESVLKGKWTAVFFGFTYCPDICPTTLQALAAAQDQLGPKADDFQVVFISVDPERDTPEQMKAYLSNEIFPKGTVGLTGTPAQVDAAAKAYRAYYSKEGEGEGYLVNHFSGAYLMNPQGRFDRILPYGIPPEELARQISAAMRG
ncbi:MAG: SCO family protein [Phenylobacterium sp.]|uniref:SCO family protein n=1 Tax=Phenylobacterium sp. TaxID=1871053 RepID=UPI00391DEE2E